MNELEQKAWLWMAFNNMTATSRFSSISLIASPILLLSDALELFVDALSTTRPRDKSGERVLSTKPGDGVSSGSLSVATSCSGSVLVGVWSCDSEKSAIMA